MIIQINRISRTGREWETYVYFPDTYSFRSAVKHLKKSKGVDTNNRCNFQQVFDDIKNIKCFKSFDSNMNKYLKQS